MKKRAFSLIVVSLLLLSTVWAIDYEEYYKNGDVKELRNEFYNSGVISKEEIPRAAYYESLVTSQEFESALTELIEGFPKNSYQDKIYFKLGIINFFKRNYSQSEYYFTNIKKSKKISQYNYWLGRLYFMKQDFAKSSKYASKYIKKNSIDDYKVELSYYMLIENSISQQDYTKAIIVSERVLELKGEETNLSYLNWKRGYCYERLENLEKALEYYYAVIGHDPYSQYSALAEERLLELKKIYGAKVDVSILYAKKHEGEIDSNRVKKISSQAKEIDFTKQVRNDTITILGRFIANEEQIAEKNRLEKIAINQARLDSLKNRALAPVDTLETVSINILEDDGKLVDRLTPEPEEKIIVVVEDEGDGRFVDRLTPEPEPKRPVVVVDETQGKFVDRLTPNASEGYVYLNNKPVGGYYIQVGRFGSKESAISKARMLYDYDINWNVVRDISSNTQKVSYIVWGGMFDKSDVAVTQINLLKKNGVDCFLIRNE